MADDHRAEVERIVSTFTKRRKRQIIAIAPTLLSVAVLATAESGEIEALQAVPEAYLLGGAFAVIIGVIIFSFYNWRCPSCNAYLGRGLGPRFCARCGAQLKL